MTERGRIAARHGAADLWSRDEFSAALARAGFRRIDVIDWGQHMTLHLAKLVDRIDRNFAQLCQEIPEDVIRFNRSYWAFTRDLAHREAIGWSFFMARK
jgi:hypothetical protein